MKINKKVFSISFLFAMSFGIALTGCNNKNTTEEVTTTSAIITTPPETTTEKESTTDGNNNSLNNSDNSDKRLTEKEYRKLINFKAQYPFTVKVNRATNWVAIYGVDFDGRYSVPYKVFRCSVGIQPGSTPLGAFVISDKYEWRMMVDGSYAQYATRINGQIMLHSVPYYSPYKNDLEVEEYNKLGQAASLGCIRLNVNNIKWIYDNCPAGTVVVVYEQEGEKPPFKLPRKKKAVFEGLKAGWDPTDPDPENPYNTGKQKETTVPEITTSASETIFFK